MPIPTNMANALNMIKKRYILIKSIQSILFMPSKPTSNNDSSFAVNGLLFNLLINCVTPLRKIKINLKKIIDL